MIAKEKLLKKLTELLESKESVLPLLEKHLLASLDFSDLTPDESKLIRDKCWVWMVLQSRHVEVLKEMIKDLEGKSGDVL